MLRNRVFFVEDDPIITWETCDAIREYGFNVVELYSSSDAISMLDLKTPVAALVTDIDLGPGPDGFEVARRARAIYPHLPVVFISGTAAARHAAEGVSGSVFIAKPFSPLQIVDALKCALPRAA